MYATTKTLVGLLGHPVGHSLSPVMHNTAFQLLGLPYFYTAFDVLPDQLEQAVQGIRAMGIRGVNVTIPHKVAVMPFLDEIDILARQIGAVNTIVNENGRLIGTNTDGEGYVKSLLEETGLTLSDQVVTMFGAGGAARAVAFTLAQRGVREIRIVNRSRERATRLVEHLKPHVRAVAFPLEEARTALNGATFLVNTTSIGMAPHTEETPVSAEWLRPEMIVSDLIYNPLRTRLLRDAEAVGATVHSGVGMFVYQGALAFERWTGVQAPVEAMRKAVLTQLLQQGGTAC